MKPIASCLMSLPTGIPASLDGHLGMKSATTGRSTADHIGTTRMSASSEPTQGVVDENLKIHGIDNLYVAGASVFPTAGVSNPTLTIVALSIRLAEHLTTRLVRPG